MNGEGFAFFRWCQYRKIQYRLAYDGQGFSRFRLPALVQWRDMHDPNRFGDMI